MNRTEKNAFTDELKASLNSAKGVFATDYRGLTVEEMTKLRFELHKTGTRLQVVKNRIALRALGDKNLPTFKKHLDYMTALAIAESDAVSSAKVLTKFAKENEKLKIKGGLVEGKEVNVSEIKTLATLPSKEVLIQQLMGLMVAVPTSFVRVLNAVPAKWVFLLEAIRKQKTEKGG